jgi:hypothetical protein
MLLGLDPIVTPDTLIRWYRNLVAQKYDGSEVRKAGRPRTARNIEQSLLDFDTAGGVIGWAGSGAAAPGGRVVYIVRYSSTPGDSLKVNEVSADSLQRR